MPRPLLFSLLLALAAVTAHPGLLMAAAPLSIAATGAVADLVGDAERLQAALPPLLEDASAWEEKDDQVRQSASLLAIVAQAIVEHEEASEWKQRAPSIRDAAIALARAEDHAAATEQLKKVNAAMGGEISPDAQSEYDWAQISKMHPAMEEMNTRAAVIRRLLRRPKDPAVDSRNAAAIALLAIATHADVHEVKNTDDLPLWHEIAASTHEHMVAAAKSIRDKDADGAKKHFEEGMKTCEKCHEHFQDE